MAKVRIYELARELGTDNKSLEKVVRGLGIEIKNYMSTLTVEEAGRVRNEMGGGRPVASAPATRPAKKVARRGPAVIRRKAAGPRPAEKERLADDEPDTTEEPTPVLRRQSTRSERPSAEASGRVEPSAAPIRRGASSARTSPASAAESAAESSESAERKAEFKPGDRIALPANTRRFAGGLANRLEKQETIRKAAGVPSRPHTPRPVESEAVPTAVAKSETPVPEAQAAPDVPEPVVAEATPETTARQENVLRDENGVIIGVRKTKAGPNIQGFIRIEPRRKQQVIITEATPKRTQGRASQRKKREEKIQQMQRRRNLSQRNRRRDRSGPKANHTVQMGEDKKRIRVNEVIQVSDLAHQMSIRAPRVIKALWKMGMRGTLINSAIDVETAELVAEQFGYTVENVSFQEEELFGLEASESEGEFRAPVVTIMGHVDHGKTTLLDYIRESRVAAGEAGGITQHTSAYRVDTSAGPVVFVDTPGHQAFSAMRERGAAFTDIVVLIVAADDGVMPTTVEAIKHARAADVPIVVAINKIDKPEANIGRVKQMLMEHSLIGEEFGGETAIVGVSAMTGEGVEPMLELLGLQAEVLDLRAPVDGRAQGVVIESRVDKGRGNIATLLVQRGTLEKGAIVVAGECMGKVRMVRDTLGRVLKDGAGPSVPIEVQGLDGAPPAGESFYHVENEKAGKQIVAHRREQRRRKESVKAGPSSVFERMKAKKVPTVKIVLRADVQGSAEAVKETLEDLSTPKVRVEVIFSGVGAISENDVKLAHAGEATIVGFNVKPVGKAAALAESEQVQIRSFDVIYEASDAVTEMMLDQLEPEYVERELGAAEVRELFPIPRLGMVCGSRVIKGSITRNSTIRVKRAGRLIHTGKISSLRVFKDDVKEVKDGFECGIVVEGLTEVEPGDVLEAFELEAMRPTL
jgi:translation initiation factor IF-2